MTVGLRARISMPMQLVFEAYYLTSLGFELASIGVQRIGVIAGQRTRDTIKAIIESLNAARRSVTGVFECDRLDSTAIDNAVQALSGSDAVVSVGGWLQTSLSMYACSELRAHLVVVATPPGLGISLHCTPIPPRGRLPPPRRFKQPMLVILDSSVMSPADHREIVMEAVALCAKALALKRTNCFVGVLAQGALKELKKALQRGDLESLLFSTVISGLANGLLRCSVTLALAKAMHSLYGIDPLLAELAILPSWLERVFDWARELESDGDVVSELAWVQNLLQNLNPPTLRQLGLKPKSLDLIVEYAWTFEHNSIEADPVFSSKYSLRELLRQAMRK
ncbi:MAG: hypothetical protein QXP94_01860 [Thermofilaceae archaeon]